MATNETKRQINNKASYDRAVDEEKLLREMDDVLIQLRNEFGGDQCINSLMYKNVISLRKRLQVICINLILRHTRVYGLLAEKMIWTQCYQRPFEILIKQKKLLSDYEIAEAMRQLNSGSEFYFFSIKRVSNLAPKSLADLLLSTPWALQLNPLKLNNVIQETFVSVVYMMHLRMADISMMKKELVTVNVVRRQYMVIQCLCMNASCLKPNNGLPFQKLGILFAHYNYNLTAIYYHLKSSFMDKEDMSNVNMLQMTLWNNYRTYYREITSLDTNNAIQLNGWTMKIFPVYSIYLFHHLYDDLPGWELVLNEDIIKNDYLSVVDACFNYVYLHGDNYISEITEFNADSLYRFSCMLFTTVTKFETKKNIKSALAFKWLVSIVERVLVHVLRIVRKRYASDDLLKSSENLKRKHINKRVLNALNLEMKATKLKDNEILKLYKPDVDKKKLGFITELLRGIADKKLQILGSIEWLKILKLFCDWLRYRPEYMVEVHNPMIAMLVDLINELPNELEFIACHSKNDFISTNINEYCAKPKPDWNQLWFTEDDFQSQSFIMFRPKPVTCCKIAENQMAVLMNVFSLRTFGHYLVSVKKFDVVFNGFLNRFIVAGSSSTVVADTYIEQDMLLIREPSLIPFKHITYVVPDCTTLMYKLNLIKHIYALDRFKVIISDTTIQELELWCSGLQEARVALSWIQYMLGMDCKRFIIAHLSGCPDEHFIRVDGRPKLNDPELCLMTTCSEYKKNYCMPNDSVVILTGYCEKSNSFIYLADLVEHYCGGIFLANVESFCRCCLHENQ